MHGKHLSWFALAFVTAASSSAQDTTRVSVDFNGAQANAASLRPSMSGDGVLVAFQSAATNLVPNDTNAQSDIFVRDRVALTTTRVNVTSAGAQSNGVASRPVISRDGRWVAFTSTSTNLDPLKPTVSSGVFVHDLFTSTTQLVSLGQTGQSGTGPSLVLDISADGNFVLFKSLAPDLVAGDMPSTVDLFVRDRAAGTTTSFTVGNGGIDPTPFSELEASISDDGRFVAFLDGNTHAAVLFDRALNSPTVMAKNLAGVPVFCEAAVVSSDGSTVAIESFMSMLPQDPNNFIDDIYIYTVATAQLEIVSKNSAGVIGNNESANPALSANGRFVFFQSYASNLVPGDTNLKGDGFVHDRVTHKTLRVSVDAGGQQGNGTVDYASISANGLEVAFDGASSNLVAGDTNAVSDIFVRSLTSPALSLQYGSGFPGTSGVIPALTLNADPKLGTTPTLFFSNTAGIPTLAILAAGLAPASIPTTAIGTLLVDPLLFVIVPVPVSGASIPVTVPDDVTICGASAYMQVIEKDAGAAAGLAFSPGLEIRPGS